MAIPYGQKVSGHNDSLVLALALILYGAIARDLQRGPAFGKPAKQATFELVFGKEVTLQTFGKDKYGRTIADVLLPDGINVNHTLVKDGWCWWYRKYAPGDTELEKIEKEAREAKKRLWVDPAPIPPRIYRKAKQDARVRVGN